MAALLVAAFPMDAFAAVIAGSTGSSEESDAGANFYYHLGTGLTGNLNSVYVTINDRSQTGFLGRFQLYRCDTATYTVPSSNCQTGTPNGTGNLWTAITTVGGTTMQSIALTGQPTKRTVRLDFGIHTLPECNPGVSCTGSAAPIALDPTKFYVVSFQAAANADMTGAARSPSVYGITTLLTDTEGNPIFCGTAFATQNYCDAAMRTPYHILTDAALTAEQQQAFGYTATAQFAPAYLANPTPYWQVPASGSDYGLSGSVPVTGADLGFFGNMMRDVFLFLFAPWDETTANAWTNFRGSLSVHVPMSYVAELNDLVQDATVASGSIPTWTYSNAALGISSVSFFSSATITSYANPTFLAVLQTLISASLWFAFLWHVYHETRHLFG